MKNKLAIIVSLAFILMGCSSEEEQVVNELKSGVEGEYSIVVFDDETPSEPTSESTFGDYQRSINNDLLDANKLWEEIDSLSYIVLNENSSYDYDYKEALSLNEFPQIMVFDNEGIVLQTGEVKELEKFFLD